MRDIERLTSIFQDVFDDPSLVLRAETSPNEISDWDSVAQIRLVLAIEESLGICFSTADITGLHCVGDFIAVLNRKEHPAGLPVTSCV